MSAEYFLNVVLGKNSRKYKLGWGELVSEKLRSASRRSVVVSNGRVDRDSALVDLFSRLDRSNTSITSLGLLIVGHESCRNTLLTEFLLRNHTFNVKFVFLVYGPSPGKYIIGNTPIFHWPLGPASYRGFPIVKFSIQLAYPHNKKREHLCNFLGTVYKESSARQSVIAVLEDPRNQKWNPAVSIRNTWESRESNQSRSTYIAILQTSDFTLCPAGFNVEAYRIYEAMTYGSVPVLQRDVRIKEGDLQGPNYKCKDSYRLLKEHNAPVIWIDRWEDLQHTMEELYNEPPEKTYQRRFAFYCLIRIVVLTLLNMTGRTY